MCAMRWEVQCYFGSKTASSLVCHTYGHTVDNIVLVIAYSSFSGLDKDDSWWSFGQHSRVEECRHKREYQCQVFVQSDTMSLVQSAVHDKVGKVFGLALQGLDAPLGSGEARMLVVELLASGTEQLAKLEW